MRTVAVKDWDSVFQSEWACDSPDCDWCVRSGMKLSAHEKSWKVTDKQHNFDRPCRLCGGTVGRWVGKYKIREKQIETWWQVKHKARIRGFIKKETVDSKLKGGSSNGNS